MNSLIYFILKLSLLFSCLNLIAFILYYSLIIYINKCIYRVIILFYEIKIWLLYFNYSFKLFLKRII